MLDQQMALKPPFAGDSGSKFCCSSRRSAAQPRHPRAFSRTRTPKLNARNSKQPGAITTRSALLRITRHASVRTARSNNFGRGRARPADGGSAVVVFEGTPHDQRIQKGDDRGQRKFNCLARLGKMVIRDGGIWQGSRRQKADRSTGRSIKRPCTERNLEPPPLRPALNGGGRRGWENTSQKPFWVSFDSDSQVERGFVGSRRRTVSISRYRPERIGV